jgi:enoyl-CoA hydratase
MPDRSIAVETAEGGIAVVTLDRPDRRNALSIALRRELEQTLQQLDADQETRVVVLTGAPPAFSAGFDLDEFRDAQLAPEIFRSSASYHRAVWMFAKPLVAAVNGAALGGGFDLAALCDLRIASEAATFGHPEIKFGAPPLFTPLRWIVGDGVARDLCLTGRRIDAAEAASIGLVSRVVPAPALRDEALSVARQIAEAPQAALETTKRYLTGNAGLGFEDSFRIEHDDVFRRLLSSPPEGL